MNSMMKESPESDPGLAADAPAGAAWRATEAMDEAALWMARLDSGSADPAAFEAWRAADPAHAVAYARVAGAWSAFDETPAVLAGPPQRRGLSRRAALLSFGGLATAVVGVGVSGKVLAREQAKTQVGERRTIRLAPGARVDLNTDSRVFWRAKTDRVTVWLERGEIAVTAGAGEAVYVRGGGIEWRLAPGRYNARVEDDRLELTTLDGVAESRKPRPIRLKRGERLILEKGVASTGEAPGAALARATAWPQGEIVFEDTPLDEAVAEYNRYLERKLTIADPEVARLRIGGRFTSSDPADFLAALQAVLPVRARASGTGVILTYAG